MNAVKENMLDMGMEALDEFEALMVGVEQRRAMLWEAYQLMRAMDPELKTVRILFERGQDDGPNFAKGFVEVENEHGKGISIGAWGETADHRYAVLTLLQPSAPEFMKPEQLEEVLRRDMQAIAALATGSIKCSDDLPEDERPWTLQGKRTFRLVHQALQPSAPQVNVRMTLTDDFLRRMRHLILSVEQAVVGLGTYSHSLLPQVAELRGHLDKAVRAVKSTDAFTTTLSPPRCLWPLELSPDATVARLRLIEQMLRTHAAWYEGVDKVGAGRDEDIVLVSLPNQVRITDYADDLRDMIVQLTGVCNVQAVKSASTTGSTTAERMGADLGMIDDSGPTVKGQRTLKMCGHCACVFDTSNSTVTQPCALHTLWADERNKNRDEFCCGAPAYAKLEGELEMARKVLTTLECDELVKLRTANVKPGDDCSVGARIGWLNKFRLDQLDAERKKRMRLRTRILSINEGLAAMQSLNAATVDALEADKWPR